MSDFKIADMVKFDTPRKKTYLLCTMETYMNERSTMPMYGYCWIHDWIHFSAKAFLFLINYSYNRRAFCWCFFFHKQTNHYWLGLHKLIKQDCSNTKGLDIRLKDNKLINQYFLLKNNHCKNSKAKYVKDCSVFVLFLKHIFDRNEFFNTVNSLVPIHGGYAYNMALG